MTKLRVIVGSDLRIATIQGDVIVASFGTALTSVVTRITEEEDTRITEDGDIRSVD